MTMDKDFIKTAASALIETFDTNLGCEVAMPIMYPNGDSVSVIVRPVSDLYTVDDCSGGITYLISNGVTITKTLKNRLIDLTQSYGCDYIEGRIQTTVTSDQLPVAIALVANASQAIGAEVKRRNVNISLREQVTNQILELAGKRVRTNEEVYGDSGRAYKVSNILLDKDERNPIAYIEAVPNEKSVSQRFTEFSDIAISHPDVTCNSVYDDTQAWEPSDLNLLSRVSSPIGYSKSPQYFSQQLQ